MHGNKLFSALFAIIFTILFASCGVQGPPANVNSNAPGLRGALRSVSVTPANPAIAANTHRQFIAIGTYENGSTDDITIFSTWDTSDSNIAIIRNTYASRGVAVAFNTPGTTTISASYAGMTGLSSLTVTTATLSMIEITPVDPSIQNETEQQFTIIARFSDGSAQNITASATWTSSNHSIALIDNKGLATAVGAGSSTITATFGGMTVSTTLTVTPPTLTSISVIPANTSIFRGTTLQYRAMGRYSNNAEQDLTNTAVWSSSNLGVATINNSGNATAVASGTTTIAATVGGVSKTAVLTVTGSGTVSLTWNAPTLFMSGAPLVPADDLKSYRLYYRTGAQLQYAEDQMFEFTDHANATITKSVTLAFGTYSFVVTAVTTDNIESNYSSEISRTIN